jgi:peptidylprolyl isomerase
MTRVRLASDLPAAERPAVQMLNTASPTFRALVDQARQAKGADFSVCDIDVPVRLAAAS